MLVNLSAPATEFQRDGYEPGGTGTKSRYFHASVSQGALISSAYNPLYSLAGLLVGMLVGLTGVGGGSLMTPILVLLFGFHPATAVGTDLLYASVTKTVGTAVHGKRGTVDWRIVSRLACGSVPAAILTLLVMSRIGTLSASASGVLNLLLGVALVLTSISVFFRPWILSWAGDHVQAMGEQKLAVLFIVRGQIRVGRYHLRYIARLPQIDGGRDEVAGVVGQGG